MESMETGLQIYKIYEEVEIWMYVCLEHAYNIAHNQKVVPVNAA